MKTVKITVNITKDNFDAVEEIAEQTGVNKTSVINKAILTEKFISEAIAEGKKILIEDKDGKIREVIFR